jgi:hypothetical protein
MTRCSCANRAALGFSDSSSQAATGANKERTGLLDVANEDEHLQLCSCNGGTSSFDEINQVSREPPASIKCSEKGTSFLSITS